MSKTILKIVLHTIIIVILTITTQIGGLVYLLALLCVKRKTAKYRLKRLGFFTGLYLISTLLIIPILAPIFGREKIRQSEFVAAHTFMTNLMNRNYVRPNLNASLEKIAIRFSKKHPEIKLVYLDANFPFINKFPLLPHLSHSDGKKIDISLIYKDGKGKLTNKKPSISGYGVYEGPKPSEYNQIKKCLDKGKWQYDFPK